MGNTMNQTQTEIRHFILDTFNDEDFEIFCTDYFRDVLAVFSSSMSLQIKAQRLIEYCQNRGFTENLLAALQKERHQQYEQRFIRVAATPTTVHLSTSSNSHQVFISHAHEDAEFAHKLANDLRQWGWIPWITPESVLPGEKWVSAIQRGLNESAVLLVVLTTTAIGSEWVNTEVEAAIDLDHQKKMRLIPILKEMCDLPILWQSYQRISFIDDYVRGLD